MGIQWNTGEYMGIRGNALNQASNQKTSLTKALTFDILMDKMQSFGHNLVISSQYKPGIKSKTSSTKVVTFFILMDKM